MSEKKTNICNWPQGGVSAMHLILTKCPEFMMGQMEYPNRTADPQEQSFKDTRL